MIEDNIYLEAIQSDYNAPVYDDEPSDEELLDLLAAIKGSN